MALNARDFTFPGQWAKGASTTIPPIPPSGFPYRNASMSQAIAENGQNYDTVADSAIWNQILYLCSGMAMENEIYGWPRWSPLTNYIANASFCLGADGIPYRAILDSGPATVAGPQDPTTTTGYWLSLGAFIGKDFWLLKRLTANLSIYVNGTTGNDATADGTQEKPFKTITAALLYVSGNYHLDVYNATIRIASGTYKETINLPSYMTSIGIIALLGEGSSNTIIDPGPQTANEVRTVRHANASTYYLQNLQIKTATGPGGYFAIECSSGGGIVIRTCSLVCPLGSVYSYPLRVFTGSSVSFGLTQVATEYPSTITLSDPNCRSAFYLMGGTLNQHCNLTINGTVTNSTIEVTNGGSFDRYNGSLPNISGNVTGPRYNASFNGTIKVQGAGPNYFPGTVAGSTATGGQYA